MNRLVLLVVVLAGSGASVRAQPANALNRELEVQIIPRFEGSSLEFDTFSQTTAAGQRIAVTRLDFLITGIALGCSDGTWLSPTNSEAYIGGRERRTSFRIGQIPARRYHKIRFCVGLTPEINHAAPAQYPATHPLNPEVNGLHWGWMGGYVFLAVEGKWLASSGKAEGFSYHIATDRQLMTVQLPADLDLSVDLQLRLSLNVDRIFNHPNQIRISEGASSTHSRTNDAVAGQLRENVERAFEVEGIGPASRSGRSMEAAQSLVEIGPQATPYPFTMPAYFPRPALPMDNPLTKEGVELGRHLFFEPRLSESNAQSCASCHQPGHGFAENQPVSTGARGTQGSRNAMALSNLAWKSSFFWDGRAASLREQVLQPIQNPIEMHETLAAVIAKLKVRNPGLPERVREADYPAQFEKAFGTRQITADRIARALEQFLLVQVAQRSKFDRVLVGQAQFTSEEQRGFDLFHTEYDPRHEQFGADCFHCHGGPLFRSQAFANNGLDVSPKDEGRYETTHRAGDRGKFAVPSLRNVAITGPYMHDGRFRTLEEVIEHYSTGVQRSTTLDPNLAKHPDGGVPLSAADKRALVAFLRTLTDEGLNAQFAFSKQSQPQHQTTKGSIE